MRISHQYKFIFFANPKTGSESVREILAPYSDIQSVTYATRNIENPFYSHITPQEVKTLFSERGWNFDEYFKFTFVRNPWAKLVSLYEMIYSTKSTNPPSKDADLATKAKSKLRILRKKVVNRNKPDFKTWLSTIETSGIGAGGKESQRWRRYGAYSLDNYIMDDARNVLVDRVIPLERIHCDLVPTLMELGIPEAEKVEIKPVNVRKYQKYTEYYDSETIDRVRQLYRYDIENFGYEFGQ